MNMIKLGGHRGMGCTDHDFFQDKRNTAALPVENTLDSITQAYELGADYIETDAVMSKDGILFTLHNVVPKDHFFGPQQPADLLNILNFSEIEQYRTGRHHNGKVARLSEVLDRIADLDPETLPWAVNLEIKGVQGSGQNFENNDYLKRLAETVQESNLAPERVLWSSFSLENVIRMSHLSPTSSYGMLFGEKPEARAIYADHTTDPHYQYLPFDTASVDLVTQEWAAHAHPDTRMAYAHPEITTVTPAMIDIMRNRNMGLNVWALFEKFDTNRADLYRRTADHARKAGVPLTIITDYLPEIQGLKL